MTASITHRTLEPFGVELELDLREELSDEQRDELRRLLEVHDLLVVPGAVLTMDQQLAFGEVFGPVLMSDSGLMSNETVIGLNGVELCFHSDYGYSPEPLQAISLHAVDVVDGESSTRFADGRLGYDSLPPELQERVASMSSLQVFGACLERRNRASELDPVLPRTEHPLAPRHEGTAGRYLFAPEMTTDSVVGLPPEESEALLGIVFDALYRPEHVLEHRWDTGDLVIWDNTRVVHSRDDTSTVEHRVLQRVTLGEKGYLDLYPELADYEWDESGEMVEGDAFRA